VTCYCEDSFCRHERREHRKLVDLDRSALLEYRADQELVERRMAELLDIREDKPTHLAVVRQEQPDGAA